MLVEFMPGTPGLDFFGLHVDLKEAFGRPVDLLTWDALENAKPDFRYNVRREERIIYEQQGT
jgi:predicted nucleotidyltransferase